MLDPEWRNFPEAYCRSPWLRAQLTPEEIEEVQDEIMVRYLARLDAPAPLVGVERFSMDGKRVNTWAHSTREGVWHNRKWGAFKRSR